MTGPPTASQPIPEPHDDTGKRWTRWLKGGSLTALLSALPLAIAVVEGVPVELLARLGGALFTVIGGCLLGRDLVHLRGWYLDAPKDAKPPTRRQTRMLALFMVFEGLLGGALIAVGTIILLSAPHPWRTLGASALTTVLVWRIASVKLDIAGQRELPRGTEILPQCREVKWLKREFKKAENVPGIKQASRALFDWTTPYEHLSRLIVVIIVTLSVLSTVGLAAVSPQVYEWLSRGTGGAVRNNEAASGEEGGKVGARPPGSVEGHASSKDDPKRRESGTSARSASRGPMPTYEDNCGRRISPGDGMPSTLRAEMYRAWIQIGEPTYGCADKAERVTKDLDVYAVRGQCRGAFRSIGVVSPARAAAVLVDEPAELARTLLERGVLRGASVRTPIGAGDFQIVHSAVGSWVLIRRQQTDGRGGLRSKPTRCDEVKPGGAAYVTLPPAMAAIWLQLGAEGRSSWPERNRAGDRPGRNAYVFRSADGTESVTAEGWCAIQRAPECALVGNERRPPRTSNEAGPIEPDSVLRLGPSR